MLVKSYKSGIFYSRNKVINLKISQLVFFQQKNFIYIKIYANSNLLKK